MSRMKEGDFVMIQFGHNDEKIDKPGVGAPAHTEYKKPYPFYQRNKKQGATPILITR